MKVAVLAVEDNGEIVQLHLASSSELLAEQERVLLQCEGQSPIQELHVTLATSVGVQKTLPKPPAFVEFCTVAERVAREDKTSVYVRVSDASQAELAQYVALIEKTVGVPGLQNPERVFHASLSNLLGTPRGSIAKVWEHTPTLLC